MYGPGPQGPQKTAPRIARPTDNDAGDRNRAYGFALEGQNDSAGFLVSR
jgi:hypothetical protein